MTFAPDLCPLCGESNTCGNLAGLPTCWCATTSIPREVLARVPAGAVDIACVCQRCATASKTAAPARGLPIMPRDAESESR